MTAAWFRYTVMLSLILASGSLQAAPMGFKDSVIAMGDFSPNWRELLVNYAWTARDAVGVSALRMRSDDESQVRDVQELTYTRLLQRWNLPEAQGNVWYIGGVGKLTRNHFPGSRTLVAPGIQVDYETTRIYAALFGRLYRTKGINHDFASARVGFSFYEADYDEDQSSPQRQHHRSLGLARSTGATRRVARLGGRALVGAVRAVDAAVTWHWPQYSLAVLALVEPLTCQHRHRLFLRVTAYRARDGRLQDARNWGHH